MKLQTLREIVKNQYLQKLDGRGAWADWLYPNHVVWVADEAEKLCERFGANKDIAVAGALLHDIADSTMSRFNPDHEEQSLVLARELVTKAGYSEGETVIIVDDIIKFHSCHDGITPESLEGKVVATADALAHFKTDFYIYALMNGAMNGAELVDVKKWALGKIERDYTQKILFEEVRNETTNSYEAFKTFFSN